MIASPFSELSFEGKTALVTGASSGIGEATSRPLAARGAAVALVYNTGEERAQQIVDSIRRWTRMSMRVRPRRHAHPDSEACGRPGDLDRGQRSQEGCGATIGADLVVDHSASDWAQEVRRLTGGKGADVVFEHVGEATWSQSLRALAHGGRLVTCGGTWWFKCLA